MKQIDIKNVNIKTSYWLGRNVRIMEPVAEQLETLRKAVTKDPWFVEYQASALASESSETAQEKFKDQLTEADNELKAFLDTETEIKIYKISIDHLDIPSEFIPTMLDFIIDDEG
jgi:hypothetical protein